ncbi:hypothetical protein HJC23_013780 [Cyclotella cryptica]|uniref:RPA-interacting protein C-terminal domain-containing protein n=1 Tax=Cyclotella cryptica TaxID=29204 RepID=A0ABD3PGL6_9STRA|eukprot:CCRYP_014935-RA/>CCRYP_014935-RA protein AED:0.03 eAED:0.03 QI:118/1/1/1/1/1/2/164/374
MSHINVHQQQHQRASPKAKSTQINSQRWKEDLRQECLERAKMARRDRFMGRRSSGGSTCHDAANDNSHSMTEDCDQYQGMKRLREGDHWNTSDDYHEMGEHGEHMWLSDCRGSSVCNDSTCAAKENPLHSAAKALIEQELQKSMMGLRHCQQILPLHDEGNASKRKTGIGCRNATAGLNVNDLFHDDDECKMSREEYAELVNAVTEELERENEMLEEELWEMERLEALERERLLDDIDDYESWEEDQKHQFNRSSQHPEPTQGYTSQFTHPSTPHVICPICNFKSLIETPHNGIQCLNSVKYTELSPSPHCNFQLDIAHEGLSLQHLQSQLAALYEEHSRECSRGILHFRMEERGGMVMLMAACQECCLDVIVL